MVVVTAGSQEWKLERFQASNSSCLKILERPGVTILVKDDLCIPQRFKGFKFVLIPITRPERALYQYLLLLPPRIGIG